MEAEEKYRKKLDQFYYDEAGKLTQYPTKRPLRMIALQRIASAFEVGHVYTEKEVNQIIKDCISFSDVVTIRRELIDYGLIDRQRNGSQYWRRDGDPIEGECCQ